LAANINVVGALFEALGRVAVGQELLQKLRSLPDDADIASWAAASHLNSPAIVEYAIGIREYWRSNPHRAAKLHTRWLTIVVVGPDRSEKDPEWASTGRLDDVQPKPGETERQYLLRHRRIFRERRAFIGDDHEKKPLSVLFPEVSPRHAEWFVFVNVAGERPTQLARRMKCDRAAVERATRKIAGLLGVQRRTWPVGHPKQ
jgi:hypothetical protein